MAWVATAIIGSAVIGAGATLYGASKAADAQSSAADKTAATSMGMYNKTREDLNPYRQLGIDTSKELQQQMPFLTSPIEMDQATLEKTPGYQFTKQQGLKAVQNSAAARGLGVSGAALKGASAFTTGLADQTYQTQFNLENINRSNAYNRLKGLVDLGENAAAQTGNAGTAAANTTSQAYIGAGDAQAAAYNKGGSAVAKAAGDIGGYYAYKGLYGKNNQYTNTGESTNSIY